MFSLHSARSHLTFSLPFAFSFSRGCRKNKICGTISQYSNQRAYGSSSSNHSVCANITTSSISMHVIVCNNNTVGERPRERLWKPERSTSAFAIHKHLRGICSIHVYTSICTYYGRRQPYSHTAIDGIRTIRLRDEFKYSNGELDYRWNVKTKMVIFD